MKNYHNLIYNFICESNNAKIIYVTNQANHCDASNILNSKNKVRNTNNIYIFFIKIIFYIEYLALSFRSSTRNNN